MKMVGLDLESVASVGPPYIIISPLWKMTNTRTGKWVIKTTPSPEKGDNPFRKRYFNFHFVQLVVLPVNTPKRL